MTASDFEPPASSGYNFDHIGYRECGQFSGTPTAGMPTEIECDELSVGRYVYVWIPSTQYMTLCEVEIFGTRKYTNYH